MNKLSEDQKAWDPKWIALLSLIFSFVPAGILHAYNYERLGQPQKKKVALIAVVIPLITLFIIRQYFVQIGLGTFLIYDLIISWYFYASQKNLFESFKKQGGKPASFIKPVIYSVIFVVIFVALLYGLDEIRFKKYEARIEQANHYSESGQYDKAEQLLRELLKEDPNRPTAYYNLAIDYYEQKKLDSAIAELEKLLVIDPNDQEAKKFLGELRSEKNK